MRQGGGTAEADRREAALCPLLREVLIAVGPDSPEATALIAAAAAGESPAALNEAIQQNPENAAGYRDRANWFVDRGAGSKPSRISPKSSAWSRIRSMA